MEFTLFRLQESVTVNKIANLHFFEFHKDFSTKHDSHPFAELVFVSKGVLQISSEGYNGDLNKNELIIHRANETHALNCPSDHSPTVIIIGFECTAGLKEITDRPLKLTDEHIAQLAEIVKEGRTLFAPPFNTPTYAMKLKKDLPYGCPQMLKIQLEAFLIRLLREYGQGEATQLDFRSAYNPSFKELVKYVDDNFLEKISIDELAFLFHTNRATLCNEFKNMTGVTVLDYVNGKKLDVAKKLLSDDEKSVTEIASALNFDSIHYFTRFFKKHEGVSPKEYRRNALFTL